MAKKNIDKPVNEVKRVGRGGIVAMEILIILLAFVVIAVPIVLPIFRYYNGDAINNITIFDIAIGGSILNAIPGIPAPSAAYIDFHYSLVEIIGQNVSTVIPVILYNVMTAAAALGIIFALVAIILAIVGIATRKAKPSYYMATCGMAIPFLFTYLVPIVIFAISKFTGIDEAVNTHVELWMPCIAIGTSTLLTLLIIIVYSSFAHKQLAENVTAIEAKPSETKEEISEEIKDEKIEQQSIDGSEYFTTEKGEESKDEEGFLKEPESDNVVVSPEKVMENQPKKVVKKVVRVNANHEPIPAPKEPVVVKENKTSEKVNSQPSKPVVTKKVVKVVKKVVKKPAEPVVKVVKEVAPAFVFRSLNKELKRLPKKLTEIDESRFENNAKIQLADIPSGISELGKSCFANCTGLVEVEIPSSVNKIANKAFYKCANLKTIRYEGTREQFRTIERGAGWLAGGGTKLVNCSDGVISVNQFK